MQAGAGPPSPSVTRASLAESASANESSVPWVSDEQEEVRRCRWYLLAAKPCFELTTDPSWDPAR